MTKLLTVRIPATSANLGPGFDCMGLALDLWNTFELHQGNGAGITVESHGEGEDVLPNDKSHLVVRTMIEELTNSMPFDPRHQSYHIVCRNAVPCGSGLGSSSTAVLAGLLFAGAILDPHGFRSAAGLSRTLKRAFEIEGHGDNVAPALLGGLVIVVGHDGEVITHRIVPPPTRVVVCVPRYHFMTSHARSVLPLHYSRSDAVFNVGRAMLVVEALRNGDGALLARAMDDRIHEPYRLPAIPGAIEAKRAALACGALAVALSGAGPGILAFAQENHDAIGQAMQSAFASAGGVSARYWVLDVASSGAQIFV
ncbi:MAG: homoserine kinase [Thermoflexales bacterium]|nr:homoserine kinase [Thermoflexales bacterium]MDW8352563.1 homoserine kinase [Anaerolineae bacterium]